MYNYDLAGNMISQADGEGRITTFEYNAANKLFRQIDHGGRTGNQGKYSYEDHKVEKYTYYPNGLALAKLDRNGNNTTYTYDCHGRMLSQAAGNESISYTYDNSGNTLTMKDDTGLTVRAYDEMNRVITKSVPNIGTAVFRYDILYTHSDGKKYVGESSKDTKGNLTTKYYDSLGRLKLVASDQQASQFTTYEYDGNGNRVSIRYPSGIMEQYTYHKNNLLETLVNKNSSGTVLESYSYTYDFANNQISKSDPKGVTEYTYDVLNRLSTAKEPGGRLTEYRFDMAGNRTIEVVTLDTGITTTLYEYNEQNRMIATTVSVNNERNVTKYSYDGNGNLTSKTMEIFKKIDPANPPTPHFGMFIPGQAEGGVTEYAKEIATGISYYSYDKLNRMIKALPVGASAAEYRYNGEGLRVEKIADSKTTRYMYEYDKVVLEVDERGRQTARNVQGLNPISRIVDRITMYYLYNGHADVTALIDGAGTIQGTYYYDAFGNVEETTGTVNNPFTYAGYQYDSETGLYYLNARMYDPKTARFMQEDSYIGDINDPLSLNLYTYCHNEPIMYIDPSGHAYFNANMDVDGPTTNTPRNIRELMEKEENPEKRKHYEELYEENYELEREHTEWAKGQGITVGDTLEERYMFDLKKMKNQPIQIRIRENTISITAFVGFTKDSNEIFPGTNYTYAEVAYLGIINNWSAEGMDAFNIDGIATNVVINIYCNNYSPNDLFNPVWASDKQEFLKVEIYNGFNIGTSHVTSFGGNVTLKEIIKEPVRIFDNWSIDRPGKITLYNKDDIWSPRYNLYDYEQQATHEFGHVLGIGDAYNAVYRYKIEAPNTKGDMMNDNTQVTNRDIEMVLNAWVRGEPQFFPGLFK